MATWMDILGGQRQIVKSLIQLDLMPDGNPYARLG